MKPEKKKLWNKILLALLIRPPIILILLPLCFLLLRHGTTEDATVEQRFGLSDSIKSPYKDAIKGTFLYSFAFCGDPHMYSKGDGCFDDLDRAIKLKQIRFVIFGGDLTYLGEEAEYSNFINHCDALTVPWYPAIGNHDIYNSGWSYYWRYLGPSVYSFNGGNAKFIVIDSAGGKIGEAQTEWIAEQLRTNKQPLLFVISHMPIYGGSQSAFEFPKTEEREMLMSLFEKYEVDIVLEGHYHSYVDITNNGVRYITSGSFSGGLLDSGIRHFLMVNVYGPEVTVEQVPVGEDIPVQYMDGEI
ncbi:metallophosphoesterase family protein [Planctomycetota bacterium]